MHGENFKLKKSILMLTPNAEERDAPLPAEVVGPDKRGNIKSYRGPIQFTGDGGALMGSVDITISIYTAPHAQGGYDVYVSSYTLVYSNGWYSNPNNPEAGLYLKIHWIDSANALFGPVMDIPAINVPCGANGIIAPGWNTKTDPNLYDLVAGCAIETVGGKSWFQC